MATYRKSKSQYILYNASITFVFFSGCLKEDIYESKHGRDTLICLTKILSLCQSMKGNAYKCMKKVYCVSTYLSHFFYLPASII